MIKVITSGDLIKISNELDRLREENKKLDLMCSEMVVEYDKMRNENEYLKQRVKEYRHKQWFPVYEENLKLAKENNHYKGMVKTIENFIEKFSNEE